jgi:hypothetical protein
VKTTKISRNAAMMTSTSLVVLGLFCAAPAMAQSTLTGAPGQALTAGTVSTTNGSIVDYGSDNSVHVYAAENNDTQTATGAELNATWSALNFASDASVTGLLTVVIDGNSRIESQNGHAVTVYGGAESVLVDTSGGGNTFIANANGLDVDSNDGSVTIRNGANTILAGSRGIAAQASDGSVTIDSVGGTIDALYSGIYADTDGGVVIGQGAGITTAITMLGWLDEEGEVYAPGNGIDAYAEGSGTIEIRTGAGGTIDGGQSGIRTRAENGATTINVGAAIGGVTTPTFAGVDALSYGGAITVNTTAAVSADTIGLRLESQNGQGSLTADIGGDVTSDGSGVVMLVTDMALSVFPPTGPFEGGALSADPEPGSIGNATLTLTGPVAILAHDQYGVDVRTLAGAINVTALDGLSSVTATNGTGINLDSVSGDINLTTNGTISSTGGAGVHARGSGDIDLRVGTVTTVGGSEFTNFGALSGFAINVAATGGSVTIDASGPVTGGAAGGINVSASGDAATTVTADAVSTVGGRAVTVFAGSGDVSIATTGAIQSYGSAILGQNAGAGTVTLHASGPVTSQNGSGLIAQNIGGFGAVTVGTADQRIGGAITAGGGNGVNALGAGDVSVYVGAVTARYRAIVAASQYSGTNGRVIIDAAGPVLSQSLYGIVGVNNGTLSTNTLSIRAGDTVTSSGGSAISAQTVGGDIDITALGAILSTLGENGGFGDGIYAESDLGGRITISATGESVSGWDGVWAANTGTGPDSGIDIYTTGTVTGAVAYGLHGRTSGSSVNIVSEGAVNGVWAGIFALATGGTGDVTVTTADVTASAGAGVAAQIYEEGTGNIRVDVTGASTVSGLTGVLAANYGTGNVTVASDTAGSVLVGTDGHGLAAQAAGGLLTVDLAGGATGSEGFHGISATNTGTGGIDIDADGAVSGRSGIVAVTDLGSINIGTILDRSTGPITAAGGPGVHAETAGDIGIFVGAVSASGGDPVTYDPDRRPTPLSSNSGFAILALSSDGSVTIDANGLVSGGAAGGIYARSGGENALSITTAAVMAAAGDAIQADAFGGDISIVTSGAISAGLVGIETNNRNGGAISILSGGTVTGGVGANGINARSNGTGTVTIGSIDQRTGAVVSGSTGVFATSEGDITVAVSSVTGGTRGIVAANQYSSGTPNGRVIIDASGAVTGVSSYGIIGVNNGSLATNTLTINTAGTVMGTGGSAISAQSFGGDIAITAMGDVVAHESTSGWQGDGIYASSWGGAQITIAATGDVVSGYDGIYAQSYLLQEKLGPLAPGGPDAAALVVPADRGIDIHTTGAVSGSRSYGIYASAANGPVNIVSEGSVTGQSDAIRAYSDLGNVAVTTADATSAFGSGVQAFSGAGDVRVDVTGASTVSGGTGVYVGTAGTGAVTVTSDTLGSTLVGLDGAGVDAEANGGLLTIALAGGVTGSGSGIYARNYGTGAIDISVGGPVSGQSGLEAFAESGAIDINLTGPLTATTGYGVWAENDETGDITISTGAVTSAYSGIRAIGHGDSLIAIATTGPVTSSNSGIDAYSYGTTDRSGVDIVAGGSITAGDGYSAIGVNLYDQGSAHVRTAAGSTLSAAGGAGVHVNVWAEQGSNNVLIDNFASIGGAGADQVNMGLNAWIAEAGNTGSIAINSTGGTIHAIERGIYANNQGSGGINIGGTAGISSAIVTGQTAIQAQTTTGAIDIRTAAGGTIAAGAAAGIFAMSDSGAITINQGGSIGTAGAGNTVDIGILAIIGSGNEALTINSTGGVYISAGSGLQSAGIYAVHNGTGAVNVTTSGIIDPGAYGVVVQGGGNVTYTATGGLVEGDLGVYANSTTGGTVNVTSLAGSTILGLNGVGVQAEGTGGAVNIAAGGSVTGTTSGVTASNTGTGATSVVVTGSATGQNGAGISVTGENGLTTVSALGNVSGTTAGIDASTTGTGALAVTTGGTVSSATGPAVNLAAGTGGLQLSLGGNVISGSGPAVVANTTGAGVINVAAGAVIAGLVNSPTDSVIALNTASGTNSTINVAQGATVQAVSGSAYTTAIRATGGSVVVNNSGNIIGQIDFSALTGANVGSISSGVGTVFQTGGLSTFSVGNDTFVNAGQLVTAGQTTTFDFRGGTNVFNNSGTVFVGTAPVNAGGSVFRLTSLTTLNNSGTLSMINGVAGDSLIAPGAAYVGSGAARLSVDTSIAGPASVSDVFTVGSTSGRTAIRVNDVTPAGSFSANNPTGVLLVSGTVHAGDFVLDEGSSYYKADVFGGVIESRGLFYSQLAVDPTRGVVLFSAPKVQAYQFATLGRQAQAVWHSAAPQTERQAEVRDHLAAGSATGGFWVNVNGSGLSRDAEQTATNAGGTVTYDTGYDQDIATVVFGVDRVIQAGKAAWLVGGSIGHVDSRADFSQGNGTIDMTGVTVSGYASVVRNGLFASASIGFNSLDAEIKARDLAGFTDQEAGVQSLGAAFEVGVRTPLANGMVFEPSLGLAYVDSQVDAFAAAGAGFGEQNAESLRVSLGARMSGALEDRSDWATRYHVSLRGIGETLGDNGMVLTSGGPALTLADRFDSPFAELRAGMTSRNDSGWSVYGDGTVRYNNDYSDLGVTIGLRLTY